MMDRAALDSVLRKIVAISLEQTRLAVRPKSGAGSICSIF